MKPLVQSVVFAAVASVGSFALAADLYVQPKGATGFTPTAPFDTWETAAASLHDKGSYAPWMLEMTDLDGRPRTSRRTATKRVVDMGCYESDYHPNGLLLLVR